MHYGQSLIYLIAFVIWVIRQIALAAARSKKNQSLNSYQARPTPPMAPPVQPVRPVPQQFGAPVQSTPQYLPQQPPQYVPQQQTPQQNAPYMPQQQYGAYPPAANYGQVSSPYSNPVPSGPAPSYGPQGQAQFGQGQYGTGQYGGAYPAPPSAPLAAASTYPAAQAYGQRDQDPNGQYGQSRQDTNQRYGHPGPQAQVSASPSNSPVQSQPNYSPPRIQKTRAAQSAPVTTSQDVLTNASGNRSKGLVGGLFTSRNAIVRAVILQEVLGPPKSKR